MSKKYDDLIALIRADHQTFLESCSNYVPRLYEALTKEEGLTSEDARDRIEKDCVEFWKIGTIRDALPKEAKDQVKAKAGKASGSARLNRTEEKEVLVTAGGSTESPPRSIEEQNEREFEQKYETKDPAPTQKDLEIKTLKEDVKKLSNAITLISKDAKHSPAYRELEEQNKAVTKENEDLRAAIEQSKQFTSAAEQESQTGEVRIRNSKLAEIFVVIRNTVSKKNKDVLLKYDALKNVVLAVQEDSTK